MANKATLSRTEGIDDTFLRCLRWLASQVRPDGRWGETEKEAVLYTPLMVQLLLEVGLSPNDSLIQNGCKWLRTQLTHSIPNWQGRIPALIMAGWHAHIGSGARDPENTRIVRGDLANIGASSHGRPEERFWHEYPGYLALLRTGALDLIEEFRVNIEHALTALKDPALKLESDLCEHFISVAGKVNHTGFAALFLANTGPLAGADLDPETRQRIQKMINWIEHSTDYDGVYTSWDNSVGVTSYVLYDLAYLKRMGFHTSIDFNHFRDFFQDKCVVLDRHAARMAPDCFATSFDTLQHERSVYTTINALRAIIANEPALLSAATICRAIDQGKENRTAYRRKRFVSKTIARHGRAVLCTCASVVILSYLLWGSSEIWVGIGVNLLSSLILVLVPIPPIWRRGESLTSSMR